MKICFEVETCHDCPFCEFESPNCGSDYYYCNAIDGQTLATEKEIKVRDASFSPITQEVTKAEYKWGYVTSEGKEWNGEIPESCPDREG